MMDIGLCFFFYSMVWSRYRHGFVGYTCCEYIVYPNVAKVGGLKRQGAEGEAVMILPRALGNAVSEVLRLSRKGRKDA
jgi:hypothetical protein